MEENVFIREDTRVTGRDSIVGRYIISYSAEEGKFDYFSVHELEDYLVVSYESKTWASRQTKPIKVIPKQEDVKNPLETALDYAHQKAREKAKLRKEHSKGKVIIVDSTSRVRGISQLEVEAKS